MRIPAHLRLFATPPLRTVGPTLPTLRIAGRTLPRTQNQIHRLPDADAVLDHRPHDGSALAYLIRLALHEIYIRTDGVGKIAFIDHEQIAPRYAGPAFSGYLVAARDVDDVDDKVGQLPRVVRRQVVAARLDQQQIRAELGVQPLQGEQVGGDVFADGGVRTAARLDGDDALGRQGAVFGQELGVLAREDVVGHGRDVVLAPQGQAEFEHERRLAGPHGPADADCKGTVREVAALDDGHLAVQIRPWAVEDFVRVAMGGGGGPVGLVVRMRV